MPPLPTFMPRVASPSVNSRCPGYGFSDYLLYVDGKAAGVIEAKKEGVTLARVETQSDYTARHFAAQAQATAVHLPLHRNRNPHSPMASMFESPVTLAL
ncbi:MAG: hypothetical protein U0932_10895 [Thiobacillus sp.]|nr:hypothetical protein [Thiobacillus sp.]